ncbi:unnamed protein product [Linum trigynum]|uniref:Protein FAR1-RELATED SEQUENCE n=1 Tax=Linum trigynum TaxID=586398 RepID=A0AAV2FUP5_9ROSI
MIKVMRLLGDFGNASLRSIPEHYIFKRWTLEARKKEVVDVDCSVGPSVAASENDVLNKLMGAFKKVCNEANKALSKTIISKDRQSVPISVLTLKEKSNSRSHDKERYQFENEKEHRQKKPVYRKRLKSVEVLTLDNNHQLDDHLSDLEDDIAEMVQ